MTLVNALALGCFTAHSGFGCFAPAKLKNSTQRSLLVVLERHNGDLLGYILVSLPHSKQFVYLLLYFSLEVITLREPEVDFLAQGNANRNLFKVPFLILIPSSSFILVPPVSVTHPTPNTLFPQQIP